MSPKKSNDWFDKDIAALFETGASDLDISQKLKVGTGFIRQRRTALGLKRKRAHPSQNGDPLSSLFHVKQTMSEADIAALYDRHGRYDDDRREATRLASYRFMPSYAAPASGGSAAALCVDFAAGDPLPGGLRLR